MSSLFDIGKSGLNSYRQALAVTGQNIANIDTDGYKRRGASLEEVSASQSGINSVGNSPGLGVRVSDIRRAFDEFLSAARGVPEVIEIQTFLGRVDVRLAVIARSMAHYQSIYRDRILTLPHIADIEALMHVATIKNQQTLPI